MDQCRRGGLGIALQPNGDVLTDDRNPYYEKTSDRSFVVELDEEDPYKIAGFKFRSDFFRRQEEHGPAPLPRPADADGNEKKTSGRETP